MTHILAGALIIVFQFGLAGPCFGAAAMAFFLSRSLRLIDHESVLGKLAGHLFMFGMASSMIAKAAIKSVDLSSGFSQFTFAANLLGGIFFLTHDLSQLPKLWRDLAQFEVDEVEEE